MQDPVDLIRAIGRLSFRPEMVGPSMIGPQSGQLNQKLGPLLNACKLRVLGAGNGVGLRRRNLLLEEDRRRTAVNDIDPLGHCRAFSPYAQLRVIAQSIENTNSRAARTT